MSMRLIDADELKEIRHKYIQGQIKFDGNEYDLIDKCQTVDAVPVVHGEWIPKQNPQWKAYHHDCCSVCGWWNTRNALCYYGKPKKGHSLNYCPMCGAKMEDKPCE